jgi:UDP-N-acetylglucosamine acyltransferase
MEYPLVHIDPSARIGNNVRIEPFTCIHGDVEIGDDTWIGSNVTIYEGARIGKHCRIFPGAVISAVPQDLKFKGEQTTTHIGDHTCIRECVTVNRGTSAAGRTEIGSHCLLMAYVHVAHDCIIGNHVIMANSVNLAGHVTVQDWAILEGYVGVSQFVTIGAHSFIAGQTGVRKNVPPFVRAAREPLSYIGINSVGLSRRGFSETMVQEIQDMYRTIYQRGLNMVAALEHIEQTFTPSNHRDTILAFIRSSEKGVIRGPQFSQSKTD